MSKPILIIKTPSDMDYEKVEIMHNKIKTSNELINDYHLFILPNITNEYEFKVFNGQYTENDYMKLEELIDELKKDK